MNNSLLDLFLDDYNVNCHIVTYKNEIDKNGNQTISNELNNVLGRFFEVGNMTLGNVESFNSNVELYVPCDIDPNQRVITNGYVEINGTVYKIVKVQKAEIFNEVDYTRIFLK